MSVVSAFRRTFVKSPAKAGLYRYTEMEYALGHQVRNDRHRPHHVVRKRNPEGPRLELR